MDAGYRRLCGKCNAEHFPRVDPVMIMLASHPLSPILKQTKCLPDARITNGRFAALSIIQRRGLPMIAATFRAF
jgi:NADH pyrophosphatase NudC (nudix superfamily)